MSPIDLHAQLRLLLSAMRASSCDLAEAPRERVFVFAQLITASLRAAAYHQPGSLPALSRPLQRLLLASLSPEAAARPSDLSSLIEELSAYVERCAVNEPAPNALPPVSLARISPPFLIATLALALSALGFVFSSPAPAARRDAPGAALQAAAAGPLHAASAGPLHAAAAGQTVRPHEREPSSASTEAREHEPASAATEPREDTAHTHAEPAARRRARPNPAAAVAPQTAPADAEAERFRAGRAPEWAEF